MHETISYNNFRFGKATESLQLTNRSPHCKDSPASTSSPAIQKRAPGVCSTYRHSHHTGKFLTYRAGRNKTSCEGPRGHRPNSRLFHASDSRLELNLRSTRVGPSLTNRILQLSSFLHSGLPTARLDNDLSTHNEIIWAKFTHFHANDLTSYTRMTTDTLLNQNRILWWMHTKSRCQNRFFELSQSTTPPAINLWGKFCTCKNATFPTMHLFLVSKQWP